MTARDRGILAGVVAVGLLAAFWILGLSPKRSELKKLDTQVAVSEQAVASARQEADQFAKDRLTFPTAYTAMVRLGKAVPKTADVPSLIVQLEHVAHQAGVDFRSVKFANEGGSSSGSASTPTPAPTPTPTPAPSTGATGAAGQSGSAGGSAAGTTGSSSPSTGGGTGATGASGSAGATAGAVPANATAAATLPLGTQIGPAQLPMMKLNLTFQGSFFKMADLLHNIRQLVKRQNHQVLVSGRLLTVDGVTFAEGDFGYPQVKATMVTTAYLLPVTQGLLDGATTQSPPGASSVTPTPVSTPATTSTPPVAVVRP